MLIQFSQPQKSCNNEMRSTKFSNPQNIYPLLCLLKTLFLPLFNLLFHLLNCPLDLLNFLLHLLYFLLNLLNFLLHLLNFLLPLPNFLLHLLNFLLHLLNFLLPLLNFLLQQRQFPPSANPSLIEYTVYYCFLMFSVLRVQLGDSA